MANLANHSPIAMVADDLKSGCGNLQQSHRYEPLDLGNQGTSDILKLDRVVQIIASAKRC